MTAIIASRTGKWMVADTQSTINGCETGPFRMNKILNLGHTLVGFAGDSALKQIMYPILSRKNVPDTREALRLYLNKEKPEGYAILVNRIGFLAWYDSQGVEYEIDESHHTWAIGSGEGNCKGWMMALQRQGHSCTVEDAKEAIKYTSTLVISVNDKCTIEYIQ